MLLLGCLLALGIAVAPRVMLIIAWIFSDRWPIVWGGDWIVPLLGIIFLPFTTVMYMLAWKPTGIDGWDWIWILLGFILDVTNWAQGAANRRNIPGYPGGSTTAASGPGATPASSGPTT